MKFSKYLIALGLAVFSVNAAAISIDIVGPEYDNLIYSTTLASSGEATEEAWIESELGYEISYNQNDGASDGLYWQEVDDGVTGDYAYDFGADIADYFLIKMGGGSGAGALDTHYLFENKDSMQWAFLNLSVFGPDVSLTNIDIISRTGYLIPEPGIVGLLAIGLLGFALARHKKSV